MAILRHFGSNRLAMACMLLFCAVGAQAAAPSKFHDVFINEVHASNIDQYLDPAYNYVGWIELYNPASSSAYLTGCWLSDDLSQPKKIRISTSTTVPIRGYRRLWMGNYDSRYTPSNIDMKLDCEGGTLYLSNTAGVLIDSVQYPPAISRCSWARQTDGGEEWAWTSAPTPQATNNNTSYATEQIPMPEVTTTTSFFASTGTLKVTIPEGCTLRYTIDGSTPTASNGKTAASGTFTTTSTLTYKFRLYKDGYIPSDVATRTLIKKDKDFTLPVLAIASSNDHFYGDRLGFFCQGTNGRPGRGQSTKCNWNMDWERPASFEYWTPDGEQVINQEVGIERCGGWSRAWLPYSFKILANKRYNLQKTIDYPIFDEKPRVKIKTLQVRNGGNDNSCRIKDAAIQEVVRTSGLYIDNQGYQPVAHYVNGVYKGTINVREANNKDYAYSNYGLSDDYLDAFEMSPDSNYVQIKGTKDSFDQWYTLSKSCASDEVYQQICEIVDIEEYINYMAVVLYIGNTDWPQNNVKGFKSQLEGGKWHLVLFDNDHAFGTSTPFTTFAGKQYYTFDQLYDLNENGVVYNPARRSGEIEIVTLFLNMLDNETFRKQFIDTWCLVAGSVFEPTRVSEIVSELADRVAPMQSYNSYSVNNMWDSSPWNTANTVINNLNSTRQSNMIGQLRAYSKFGLTYKNPLTVTMATNLDEAKIYVNDLPVPTNKFSGSLFTPAVLKASAPAGYKFTGWRSKTSAAKTLLAEKSTWYYYDKGSLDGKAWYTASYSTSGWSTGKAPLGYYTTNNAERGFGTVISYGGNSNSKYPTYYFRTSASLSSAPAATDVFTLNYTIDDGFIIYVNGVEAGRYNMPSGTVSYNTYATTYANSNPDVGSMVLPTDLFRKGANVIAVEVHNNSANSTDVQWEGSISYTSASGGTIVCSTEEYTLPNSGTINVIACYEEDENATGTATHPIVINEVSAGNDVFVSDLYKKDDWVELYNTTNEDIDLAGMYLSDNIKKPTKWKIEATGSATTIIPAHGYKLIWCDKKEAISELHATFKLGNDDGSLIMLTAADGSWADTLFYDAHDINVSVGRFPDGGEMLYTFNRPTPDATNRITHSALATEKQNVTGIDNLMAEAEWDDTYQVYDLSGRQVASGEGRVSVSGLPSGVYVVKRGKQTAKIVR